MLPPQGASSVRPTIVSRLAALRHVATDVTLQLQDGQEIQAHKIVLAAQSRVFEIMLFGPFKEGHSDNNTLNLPHDDSHAMKDFIDFFYTGKYASESVTSTSSLVHHLTVWSLADKYDCEALKEPTQNAFVHAADPVGRNLAHGLLYIEEAMQLYDAHAGAPGIIMFKVSLAKALLSVVRDQPKTETSQSISYSEAVKGLLARHPDWTCFLMDHMTRLLSEEPMFAWLDQWGRAIQTKDRLRRMKKP